MRARSRGTVFLLAVGLVPAVAVPAGAQPAGTPPAQQIVTATARTSTLTMKAGYSHYLFVGGSSAGASITDTTFGHYTNENCGHPTSQGPVGPSAAASPQGGSFTTTGTVALIAGVAVTGYSVRHVAFDGGGIFDCGSWPSRVPVTGGVGVQTGKTGGLVVLLVGTEGVGTLAPTLTGPPDDSGTCLTSGADPIATLQNVTVSKGQNDGGAVAVFTASVAAENQCNLIVDGTSYNKAGTGNFGMWAKAYLLVPDKA